MTDRRAVRGRRPPIILAADTYYFAPADRSSPSGSLVTLVSTRIICLYMSLRSIRRNVQLSERALMVPAAPIVVNGYRQDEEIANPEQCDKAGTATRIR